MLSENRRSKSLSLLIEILSPSFGALRLLTLVAKLRSDATNWEAVRLIDVVLWVDGGAVEAQVPSAGA